MQLQASTADESDENSPSAPTQAPKPPWQLIAGQLNRYLYKKMVVSMVALR